MLSSASHWTHMLPFPFKLTIGSVQILSYPYASQLLLKEPKPYFSGAPPWPPPPTGAPASSMRSAIHFSRSSIFAPMSSIWGKQACRHRESWTTRRGRQVFRQVLDEGFVTEQGGARSHTMHGLIKDREGVDVGKTVLGNASLRRSDPSAASLPVVGQPRP